MIQKTPISLKTFFIYNPKLGPQEGEEEKKILFYYPPADDLDTKIKNVGLCEAIVKFTNTFTNDDSCQHLQTQKTTQFYYQPEKDFWMIMTLNVPYDKKDKDGTECNEYKPGDVHVGIFREVLKQSYNMFRLFFGQFSSIVIKMDMQQLHEKLDAFFSQYLLTLKLQNCDIVHACRSVQYLPLTQLLFLRVHNFIQMLQATFAIVKHCIFMYNEQIVWSEINATDLYSIYEYMSGTIFSKAIQTELPNASLPYSYSVNTPQYGMFITEKNSISIPQIYIFDNENKIDGIDVKYKIFNLVIYRALSATICLLIEEKAEITEEIYVELHSFIGPQLTNIASDIADNFVNPSPSTSSTNNNGHYQIAAPQFLFLNELNFKHTGTFSGIYSNKMQQQQCHSQPQIPTDVMNLLADLHVDGMVRDALGGSRETVLKTHNDYWIVKKTNNWRHFYVIVNKSSTLLEITEDAKRLFDEHARNLFF